MFASKAPKVQEVVEITASATTPTPTPLSFANIINFTYSKYQNDPTIFGAVMDQNV